VASKSDSATQVGKTFTINKEALTVTAEAKSKTYGDADPTLTYTASGLVGSDKLTGALTRAAGNDVGTYAIQQGTLAASGNYALTYVGANLTINKKALTVTAAAKSKTYGDADPALTYSVTGLVGTDRLTGALARASGDNVGAYAIQQGTLTAGDNYTLPYVGAKLTVGKKIPIVSYHGYVALALKSFIFFLALTAKSEALSLCFDRLLRTTENGGYVLGADV
jgi:hypothetical protein